MKQENNKVGRPKGQKKYGGRTKGTPNKTTQITRQLLNDLAEGILPQVIKDLLELEPADRVKIFIKLCEFCVSKPQTINLETTAEKTITIEEKLIALSQMQKG